MMTMTRHQCIAVLWCSQAVFSSLLLPPALCFTAEPSFAIGTLGRRASKRIHVPQDVAAKNLFRGGSRSSMQVKLVNARSEVPEKDSKSKSTSTSTVTNKLLRLVFKGVTLPFPTLRNLVDIKPTPKQEHKKMKMRVGFSMRESILAIVIYLALGVVSYTSTILQRDQAWSFVDALYFGVVTFTSVGYGDLCPTTTAGKMFTILFGLSGIALLGAAVATIGSRVMEQEDQMIQAAQKASRKRLMNLFHSLHIGGKHEQSESPSPSVTETPAAADSPTSSLPVGVAPLWRHTIRNLLHKSIPAIFALLVGGTIMGRMEGWSTIDSIYYAFITAGTLGYGDFSPHTRRGRIWGIVFIPLAVAAAGEVLGSVATVLLERRQEEFYENLMERELDIQQLLEMDTDKNGRVSREEYVQFMLKEMELVPNEQFEELHAQFERLDVDGDGYLDKEDLKFKNEEQKTAPENKD